LVLTPASPRYAELIQNRAFQNATLDSWSALGGASLSLDTSTPLSQALPHSVKVTGGTGTVGIKNGGYWGIDVKKANTYTGSFYSYGAYCGRFTASLVSNDTKQTFATTTIKSKSVAGKWTQHTFELRPTRDAPNSANSFVLQYTATPDTELKFNLISLFPPTYKNRANGMRPELMEKLKALNPSYIRCPGGNNM
jgi:alpha-N-arabinofuranosidase